MGMACKICNHPKRLEIDRALVEGGNISKIAKEYGVPYNALYRHSQEHLSRQLVKAYEMRSSSENMDLMNRIDKMIDNAQTIFQRNFDKKKDYLALQALNSQKGIIELLAKISAHLHQSRAMELEASQKEDNYEMKLAIERLPTCELEMLGNLQDKLTGKIKWKRLLPDRFYKDEEKDYIDVSVSVDKGNDIEPEKIIVRAPDEGGVVKTSSIMNNFVDVPVPQQEAIEPEPDRPEPEPEPAQPSTMTRRRRPLARVDFGPNMPEHKKRSAAKAYVHEHGRLPREKWLRDAL